MTALGKHPYPPLRSFPRDSVFDAIRPLDARGSPEGRRDPQGAWHDALVPRYTYDRDALGFFPYQLDAHRFVIPIYVMTRDLGHVYDTEAPTSDPRRLDLPAASFRLHIGAIDGKNAQIAASDPLIGATVPVKVVERARRGLVGDMPATDSPRPLTIEERAKR